MATPVKILLTVLAVLLGAVALLAWLIQTQLTPERIRQSLLPVVASRLDRQVEFSSVQIGLLSGVTVEDLKISGRRSEQPLLSVERAQLNYRWWRLLSGKIVIDRIACAGAVIHLTRLPSGKLTIADLLTSVAGGRDRGEANPAAQQPEQAAGFPLKMLVEEISLTDGTIFFVDQYLNPQAPYRYQLNKISFRARRITLDRAFPMDLSAVINDAQLALSGHYNFAAHQGDLVLQLEPLDLVRFAPYYRDKLPARLDSAVMALNLEIDIQARLLQSKGRVDLSQVDLVFAQYPDAPLTQLDLQADYALTYQPQGKRLDFSTLLLSVNGLQLDSAVQLDLSEAAPQLQARVNLQQLDLRQFLAGMPPAFAQRFEHYSPAGSLAGELQLAGNLREPKSLLRSAELQLTAVQASFDNLRTGLNGALSYAEGELKSDALELRYGDFNAQLQFAIDQLWARPIKGTFHLFAQQLDLNQLKTPDPGTATDSAVGVRSTLPTGSSSDRRAGIGSFDLPLQLQGQVDIKRLIYRRLVINQLHSDLSLANKRLTFTNLSALLGTGKLAGNLWLDRAAPGLKFQGDGSIQQAELKPLLGAIRPQMKVNISGKLNWTGSFSGTSREPEALLDSLRLSGQFQLLDGLVEGSPLLQQVAAFLGIQELKVLSFASMTGNYALQGRVVDFNGRLDSSRIKLFPHGTWDLLGPLQMRLDTRLAPALMAEVGIRDNFKEALLDEQGWGLLPLRISGSVAQPRVTFDPEALQAQSLEQGKRQAAEKLLEKMAPEQQQEKPMRQLLDQTLNRLFGR